MNRRGAQDTCGDLKQFQGKESPQFQCNGIADNSKEHSWRRPPLSRSKCSTPSSMGASSWQHSTPITHAYHHSNSTEDGVPWRSGSRNTTFSHSSSYDGGKLGSSQQSFLEADLSPIASHTSSCGAQENTNVDILGCGYNGSPLTHSSPYNTPGPQDAKPRSSKSPSCHSSYNSTSSLYRSDGLPKSFSSRSSSSWVCPADVEQAVLEHFGKKYEFKPPAEGWTLPDAGLLFKDDLWTSNIFQKLKRELNEVKSQLNDFSLDEWHRHTRFMNKAGDIIRRLRDEVDPEFPTQAWCKFYENVSSTSLVPKTAIDNSVLNTIHLCEAPGAFITSLNHFLTLRHPNIIWKWLATTLNPYYEGNPLSIMINDDRFILQTLDHWTFGEDNTGDLMNVNNMKHLLRAAADMGPVALVTADGSIDCQDDPGEQESVVAALHYCEAVTALHALAPGGSFLLKMFTMYEQPTICLMYLLCCAFTTVVVNKPATSKEGNSEVYVCCMGYHGSYTLQPWLKVLTKHFSPEPSSKAMFPKKSIPRHFVEQLHACASIFKKYQSDVIQNNIDTYRDRHMNRSYVKQLRRAIADEFFNRYQMRKINPKHEIIGKRTVQHSPYLNKDSKTEDVSFNERLKKKEVEPLIKLYHLEEELAQLEISWPFEEDVNWLCFSNCVTGFKLTLGKPVKTVNSSKFCQGNILNIRNRVKAAAQEFNLLKTPVTESNKPLIPQWVKNKFPKQSWAEFKIINYKEQLWDSMEGSKNEDYEKNAFIDIMELKSSMLVWLCLLTYVATTDGMLYPQESETREVVSLDGIWKFKWDKNHEGFSDIWFSKELQNWTSMPVPSSFNDIPVSSSLRDHVGWVWYQRSFYAPTTWLKHNLRVFIRLGSVHYAANVWLKGELVTSHRGGALPFQGEVTQSVNYGGENIVTVAANNTLSQHTIPQGTVLHTNNTNRYPLDYTKYSIVPDYFNYAGIHRPVVLYTVPQTFIDDIIVHTDINDTTGVVHYTVSYNVGEYGVVDPACHVELLDHQGVMVSNGTGLVGTLYIPEANFWWPRLTHSRPGYLYTLKISLIDNDELLDVYRLCIGLRTLQWNSTTLLLNKRPIYLAGFGKHEDANLRGKGLDNVLLVRDYNLMTWLGANSFRTSHYPYAEETLLMADQEGFMVIDESPACSLDGFDVILLEEHKAMLQEMVLRDKNHPSVIMWSLANEPRTDKPEAEDYFRTILEFTRGLDNSRPITFVTSQGVHIDKAVQYMDIICVNRYRAWYSDPGRLDLISYQVERELTNWHDRFKKPVLVTEYGAGAISGMHVLPAVMWTEDYLMLTLKQHFPVFDKLRGEGFLLGEMIWNFADFQTPQEVIRPVRCVKGLFTRERQPKMAAHLTRWRYWSLAANMTGIALPADLMFIGVP